MVYPITKRIVYPIFNLWVKEVNGMENVPKKSSFIIAANHESYFDHIIIVCNFVKYLDKKVHFLSKKEHFDTPLKAAWHNWAGAIPLDRENGGKEALKWAIKALKEGKIIAIHPEGTRSLTGKIQKAKTGIARLALKAKVPIIPVGLINTFEILPKGKYIPKAIRATMNIGKPIGFNEHYNKKINKRILNNVTIRIMKEVARLSKQKYDFKHND
jgi:1-acyl-sn-glycerol-3-phosphate acyltransferase